MAPQHKRGMAIRKIFQLAIDRPQLHPVIYCYRLLAAFCDEDAGALLFPK